MSESIDDMIRATFHREGAYNDVKGDRGGATNLGISLRFLRSKGIDVDGDGDTDADDVKAITPEIATRLYKEHFFFTPKIDKLPLELQPQMFDFYVNSGAKAIMVLQDVCNLAGFGPLKVDGVAGPGTRRAAHEAQRQMGPLLNNAIMYERLAFLEDLAKQPDQGKFRNGWLRRAREFEMPVPEVA